MGSCPKPAGCLNLDLYLNLNLNLAAKPRLCLSRYLSLFLRKYRPTYLQACRDLCLWLNPAPCPNLCLDLSFCQMLWKQEMAVSA